MGTITGAKFKKEYYQNLANFLKEEYEEHVIYPKVEDIFNALQYTSYENTKVVILGQDPYMDNQAHGLAFRYNLVLNAAIIAKYVKELRYEYDYEIPNNGYLVKWAEQGILLLNTVLTVRQGEANSHKGKGWEHFTVA